MPLFQAIYLSNKHRIPGCFNRSKAMSLLYALFVVGLPCFLEEILKNGQLVEYKEEKI